MIFTRFIFDRWQPVRYSRPFLSAACVTVFYLVSTIILSLIYRQQALVSALAKNIPKSLLMGFGLGVGFEVAEFLLPQPEDYKTKTA